jgi:ribosomal protein S18 acetylase RimI-like enzyme
VQSDIKVQNIKLTKALDLRRLFKRAVEEDFSYFPDEYQQQVLRENNLPRLAFAAVRPARLMLGACRQNRLIGYIIAGVNGNQTGKIYWLYVSPEGRGQQLGRQLLEKMLELLRRRGMMRVSLVTHNYDQYYAKLGFQRDRVDFLYGVEMKAMSYQWAK